MNNYLKRKNEQSPFDDSTWFKDFFQMPSFFKQDSFLKTDIIESNNTYTLIMDVPGCKKEDVKISNEDGYLTVEVSQTYSNNTSENNYIKRERMHGNYSRSYYIGNNVESKDINARFSNGLLEITLPKTKQETNTNKYIPIKDK